MRRPMRPTPVCSLSAGAAVIAATAVAGVVAVAAAAEQQNKNDDQPDAGTVVVKAHFVTSLVLL